MQAELTVAYNPYIPSFSTSAKLNWYNWSFTSIVPILYLTIYSLLIFLLAGGRIGYFNSNCFPIAHQDGSVELPLPSMFSYSEFTVSFLVISPLLYSFNELDIRSYEP